MDYCNLVLAGLPVALLQRLQSVLNAAARLAFSLTRRSEQHTLPSTTLVASSVENSVSAVCSDLSLPQRHCAPQYVAETLQKTANVEVRRRSWSAGTSTLIVLSTRRLTLCHRAFPVAAARAWNALPSSVRAYTSLLSSRRDLKTSLCLRLHTVYTDSVL